VLKDNPALAATFRNDSGDVAPDPLAYDRWFSAASVPRRKKAVGARRYAAVTARLGPGERPQWGDFVYPDGKLVPAAVLKAESQAARMARRGEVHAAMRRQEDYLRQVAAQGFLAQRD
jgi:hypothetical protein